MRSSLRLIFVTAAVSLIYCCPLPLIGQQVASPAPTSPGAFDPSDVYFQAWLLCNDADKLIEEGKHSAALKKLRRANQLFTTISRNFPDWRKDMIAARQRKTIDDIAKVTPKAMAAEEQRGKAVAELEGKNYSPGKGTGESMHLPQSGGSNETMATKRVRSLEQEISQLHERLQENQQSFQKGAQRSQAKQQEITRERDQLSADLQRAQSELKQLRDNDTSNAMHEEIAGLARRIRKLEDQRDVMGRALEQSRRETEEVRGQVDALQQERARLLGQIEALNQEVADVKRDLELERKTSNEVVAGQLKQIRQLQATIRKKDEQLAEAQKANEKLQKELREVRASFDSLQEERDELLRERDQMAALLKLNEAGQLQAVIDQNLALDRELREMKKRYDAMKLNHDATAGELASALRDLSIAKLRIQEFRQTHQEQEKRLNELQQRLRNESLTVAEESVNPEEADMLRNILNRQIKIQEKRMEARGLLFEQLDKIAEQDPEIKRAMDHFRSNELDLSPEELAVIEGQVVDGTIISPYARPRSEAERAFADLTDELKPYDAAATRAYLENRPLAAREAWSMILERNPGDVATMCKLGLVEYELGDEFSATDLFRRASELEPDNPYAHRMLGYFLDRSGQRAEALAELERAIELRPTDSRSHQLLGNVLLRLGKANEARDAYLAALDYDPNSAETHYNLTILFVHEKKKSKALEHYQLALELGVSPNEALEKQISQLPKG